MILLTHLCFSVRVDELPVLFYGYKVLLLIHKLI